jgi:hypothetical protein
VKERLTRGEGGAKTRRGEGDGESDQLKQTCEFVAGDGHLEQRKVEDRVREHGGHIPEGEADQEIGQHSSNAPAHLGLLTDGGGRMAILVGDLLPLDVGHAPALHGVGEHVSSVFFARTSVGGGGEAGCRSGSGGNTTAHGFFTCGPLGSSTSTHHCLHRKGEQAALGLASQQGKYPQARKRERAGGASHKTNAMRIAERGAVRGVFFGTLSL